MIGYIASVIAVSLTGISSSTLELAPAPSVVDNSGGSTDGGAIP